MALFHWGTQSAQTLADFIRLANIMGGKWPWKASSDTLNCAHNLLATAAALQAVASHGHTALCILDQLQFLRGHQRQPHLTSRMDVIPDWNAKNGEKEEPGITGLFGLASTDS